MLDEKWMEWRLYRGREVWQLVAFDADFEGGYEVTESLGPAGERGETRLYVESTTLADAKRIAAERLAAARADGFVDDAAERLVLGVHTALVRDSAEREAWRDAIVERLTAFLSNDCQGHFCQAEFFGAELCLFFQAVDLAAAVAGATDALVRSGWKGPPYRIGRWDGGAYREVAPGSGRRLEGLARDGVRRVTLADEGTHFRCGHASDGRAILMGLRGTHAVAYLFSPDGALVDCRREVGGAATVASWQRELGFSPGAIAIRPFFDLAMGVGIEDAPWDDFERGGGDGFVLYFGDEFTDGVVPRSGSVRFLGPAPSTGNRLTIPFEPAGRFDFVGAPVAARELLVMAFVTGAFPTHPKTGRPEYPGPNDPPSATRWYGVLHLFDREGGHLQTIVALGGTSADGREVAAARAEQLIARAYRLLGTFAGHPIDVRRFSVEHDGYLFGLRDEEDYTVLWPNDIFFHAPWDGSYSS